jgi:DHA1 family bicyclomycin/chloramphenicol resistance-like MFS transporter
MFLLPRVRASGGRSVLASLGAYAPIVRDPQAIGYMMLNACGFMGVVAFVSTASFVFVDFYRLEPWQFGICFSLVMLGGSVGAWTNSHYVRELGISRMIGFGTSLLACAGVGVIGSALLGFGIVGLVVSFMIYVFGIGFVFANAVARTLSRYPMSMGAASSVFGVNQFMLGGIVAALLSRIVEPTPMPMAWVVAGSGVGCAAVWWLWLHPTAPQRD